MGISSKSRPHLGRSKQVFTKAVFLCKNGSKNLKVHPYTLKNKISRASNKGEFDGDDKTFVHSVLGRNICSVLQIRRGNGKFMDNWPFNCIKTYFVTHH